MSLPVRTTPEADAHIREIDSWWRGNRPASPELFVEELTAAFDIVGHAPHIGRLYRQSPIPSTRRRPTERHWLSRLLRAARCRGEDSCGVACAAGVGPPLRAS